MGSGEVSWYFYNAFSNVWGNDAKGVKGLERAFKNQIERHPKYEIWVCDRPSLGGAMASLAAYHIAKTYNKISERINERIKLVTFGEPRTGNAAYAEDFNKKNGRDDTNPSNFLIFSATGLDLSIRDTVASWRTKRLICKAFTLVVTLCLAASLNAVRLFDYNFVRNQMFPLAAAAYSDEPRGCILNRFKGYNGTHGNLFFDHNLVQCDGFENDCYGFLATLTEQSAIVLSFRGTNYLSQLKNEVATSAAVVPMGLGEVSWYFYNAFSKVWGNDAKGVKGLERAFKDQIERHPKYEIWVTVLSLGGAMASLAAYHIAKTYNKISERINERIKLVTFGEPRTGNAAYAEDFNKKMFGLIATLSLVVVGAHSAVFSDDFAYNNMLPLAAAAYSDHPDACVRNHFNGQIYRFYKVDCKGPWSGTASVSCAAYTALLPSRKAIVLSFRGTNTPMQLFKELVHCRLNQENGRDDTNPSNFLIFQQQAWILVSVIPLPLGEQND
ncbi:unnamed protein product [Cylicocyclus nassatus]|uniref:Fungal lipase-type domain-containing protein n=1 Tax=Cylicocyclus nassatus TaxID=53992 RepID=A0AA36M4M1_CYLNA|nr:unnamed protein product [Cylicocyclus nassatus]